MPKCYVLIITEVTFETWRQYAENDKHSDMSHKARPGGCKTDDYKSKIITTSIYDFGWGALDGSTDAGGDKDLTAYNILIIGNKSENKTNLIKIQLPKLPPERKS